MKLLRTCIYILFFICMNEAFSQERDSGKISEDWLFFKENTSVNVSLPHTWNKEDGTGNENRQYYRGSGMYVKNFQCLPQKDKKYFLKFEAVSSYAEVYLNDHFVGKHAGAFNAFCFDITPYLIEGENKLVVNASNEWNENIAPLAGDFTVFGGIYRDVWLITTNQVCITPMDYASSGVYVKQTHVDDKKAILDITVKLANYTNKKHEVTLQVDLVDREDKNVLSQKRKITLPQNQITDAFEQLMVEDPILWNGRENPYLYKINITVFQNSKKVDTISENIGLRYYRIDPEKGFFLNGKPYKIKGVNRHQDREGMGWGITQREH